MIQKAEVYGKQGWLFIGPDKKGVFVTHVEGTSQYGAYDKVNITEAYMGSDGKPRLQSRRISDDDIFNKKTIATGFFNTIYLDKVIDILQRMNEEMGSVSSDDPNKVRDLKKQAEEDRITELLSMKI